MSLLRRKGHGWAARMRNVRLAITLPHRKKVEPREVPHETFYVDQDPVVRVGSIWAGAPGRVGFNPVGYADADVGTGSQGPACHLWLRRVHREQPLLDHRSPRVSAVRPLSGNAARHRPQDG